MNPLYRICDWDKFYETSETRKLENLRWTPIPNKHDGLGFRRLVAHPKKCELFAAWVLLIQVAARARRGYRGSIERDGQPLTADDLAVMTGFPERIFTYAFEFFAHPKQGWLTVVSGESARPPADSAIPPGESPAVWKGREGREGSE